MVEPHFCLPMGRWSCCMHGNPLHTMRNAFKQWWVCRKTPLQQGRQQTPFTALRHRKKRRRRFATLTIVELIAQWVNTAFFVIPNAVLLAKSCSFFSELVGECCSPAPRWTHQLLHDEGWVFRCAYECVLPDKYGVTSSAPWRLKAPPLPLLACVAPGVHQALRTEYQYC